MSKSKIIRATPHQIELYNEMWSHFGTQEAMAKALKVTQPAVYQYVIGRTAMAAHVAMRAERVTDGLFLANQLCLKIDDEVQDDVAA